MTTKYEAFKALHGGSELFILPNAWNAESASILQKNKFQAVGTSSAAVASSLGYADGEEMPFEEYLVIIRRIAATVTIPVTVDFEMGYGKTPDAIYANIQRLLDAGVVGINIEDSALSKGKRYLNDASEFAHTVQFLRKELAADSAHLFINVRCDTYLLDVNDKQKETTARIKLYQDAGADGIFLPFIKDEHDIEMAVNDTRLPINVMALAGLPDTKVLNDLGVRRVSMGPFLFAKTYRWLSDLASEVVQANNIQPII